MLPQREGAPRGGPFDLLDERAGYRNRNSDVLEAVPFGVVTTQWYEPRKCGFGTVAVIDVDELTVNTAAVVPSFTDVVPVKFVPMIVTFVPWKPCVGVNPVIVGPGAFVVTVKFDELAPVPMLVVTAIGPVVAPPGTLALMLVSELTVKFTACVPLNVTAVALVKPVPVIETFVPTGPLVGVNDVTVGPLALETTNCVELVPVPLGVVTVMNPLVAPVGTWAEMSLDELTAYVGSAVPLNLTAVAPVKFVPWMSTAWPTCPLVGLNDVIVGPLPPPPTIGCVWTQPPCEPVSFENSSWR